MLSLHQASVTLIEEEILSAERVTNLFPSAEVRSTLFENRVLVPHKAGTVKVKFVGVIACDGFTVQILPKVFANSITDPKPVMAQVVRTLRKYANFKPQNEIDLPFLDPTSTSCGLNILAICDWLIRDYLNGGIYRRVQDRQQRNGQGAINWARTIDNMVPFSSQGQVLYLETINKSAANDDANFISRLHLQILSTVSGEFGHLLGYSRLSLENEPFEPFETLPPIAIVRIKVNDEMRQVFSDRTIRLLGTLLAAMAAFDRAKASKLALYGTSAFYDVWEKACSLLIGNERERWTANIPRPLWKSETDITEEAKTFIPDIVTRISQSDGEHLLIADAKYYQLSMPPNLAGQPGVNDVAKQLWYQQCLTQAALDLGISVIHNVFIVPDPTNKQILWADGSVSFEDKASETIRIIRLSALQALEKFSDGAKLSAECVSSAIIGK